MALEEPKIYQLEIFPSHKILYIWKNFSIFSKGLFDGGEVFTSMRSASERLLL